MARGPYFGMDYQTFRKVLQGLMLAGGIYLMFPSALEPVLGYKIIEFITPAFIVGAFTTYYTIQALRGKI